MEHQDKHIAIIGAGLVGCVNACFLARRGFVIDLYENREDTRLEKQVTGRSINLALSHRGRSALRAIGLEDKVIQYGIPCYSRYIHNKDGSCKTIPYGKKDQHILAMDRKLLNEILLTEAEKFPGVAIFFGHKLVEVNLQSGEVTIQNKKTNEIKNKTYDLVIGNDGAYSAIRKAMLNRTLFDYQQEYIPHNYLEILFPSDEKGNYTMPLNHLHIWPRNQFMLIALPNRGGTFTGTIFMPREMFKSLRSPDDVIDFFTKHYPDALELIGREKVVERFATHESSSLISIKCSPYHVGNRCVIMGDASHALVPFYGQGMNAGFEDALILDELMGKYNCNFDVVLPEYTRVRTADDHAICDLSMGNYIEMRQSTNSKLFLLRKTLDNFLYWLFPKKWVPLYTMVSFTRIPYSQCIEDRKWQDKVLTRIFLSMSITSLAFLSFLAFKRRGRIEEFGRKLHGIILSLVKRKL